LLEIARRLQVLDQTSIPSLLMPTFDTASGFGTGWTTVRIPRFKKYLQSSGGSDNKTNLEKFEHWFKLYGGVRRLCHVLASEKNAPYEPESLTYIIKIDNVVYVSSSASVLSSCGNATREAIKDSLRETAAQITLQKLQAEHPRESRCRFYEN